MVYATFSNKPFVTTKDILGEKKPLSEEARARKDYIRSHNFSVHIDQDTGKAELKVVDNKECKQMYLVLDLV